MEHLLSHGLCHERVVIRVRIYVPIAVDAYVLDADDLAVFRAQTSAATATEDTSLLSVRLSCRLFPRAPGIQNCGDRGTGRDDWVTGL